MSRRRRFGALLLATTLALTGLAGGIAQAATTPTATFAKVSDWGTGFTGQVVVRAGTTALSGWTVEFDLPSGTSIGSAWEADMTRTGDHYRFINRHYNGSVPASGTTAFGFNGAGPGSPLNCTVNGNP